MTVLSLAAELLRRTSQPSTNVLTTRAIANNQPHGQVMTLTGAGLISIIVLMVAYLVIVQCFRYTCWSVVGTLAFIEKDSAGTEIDINNGGPPAYTAVAGHDSDDVEARIATPKSASTVTSGIRRALRHLHSIGGVRSYFRGFACAFWHTVFANIIVQVVSNALNVFVFGRLWFLGQIIGGLVATFLLIQISTAWTHIVISEPSPKRWTRRLPGFRRTLRNLWLVTLVKEVCFRIALLAPLSVASATGLLDPKHIEAPKAVIGHLVGVMVMALVLSLVLVLPASIALTRAQASMLPEEDETIVAFDRSFDGKVEPAIIGGSGALGLVDAWKTVDRAARLRVAKLFAKLIGIEVALHVVFTLLFTVIMITSSRTKEVRG